MLKRVLKDKTGATATVFAISAPLLIGGITLAVELGHWHQKRSKLQNIADTAAMASAQEILLLGDAAKYEQAGKGHAFENGFNFTSGQMTVLNPPVDGTHAGNRSMVEVTMSREQDLYFAQFFGTKSVKMQSRALATILPGIPACILSLSPDMWGAISSGGSSEVTLSGCSLHSNSASPGAIDVKDLEAECISAAGGIVTTNETVTHCRSNLAYGNRLPDPYADITIPTEYSYMGCSKPQRINKTSVRLKPGRYCKTISESGTIDFSEPGTYYFDGARLKTVGQTALIYGRGVTLVFLNDGSLTNATGSKIDITAPTSGPFKGIAIYYDRETTTPDSWFEISGNQQSTIEGVIYAPTVNLKVTGAANSSSDCTQIVANSVQINGNAQFTNSNCDAVGAHEIGGLGGVALIE